MANQTVYPYGTNGELPSSIGIINDTTTGGADKALSAQQGKVLASQIGVVRGTGSYQDAYVYSLSNPETWSWILVEEVDEETIRKPIWHIGNQVFIDASGAVIEFEIDDLILHNLKFTVKLTEDNQTIHVPTSSSTNNYDMVVDWGDGSPRTTRTGSATLKTVGHTYSGSAGDTFQITIGGMVPVLSFCNLAAWERETLISVDNNTLQYPLSLAYNSSSGETCFRGCANLETICANAFQNVTDTVISFIGNNKLSSSSAFAALASLPDRTAITRMIFENAPATFSLTAADLVPFTGITSFFRMFYGSSIVLDADVMAVLKSMGSKVTSYGYMFYNYKGSAAIPNDFFDMASENQIAAINGFTYAAKSGSLSGDAGALYASAVTKITENALYNNAFSYSGLSNRNQVPTTWGGTLSVE